MLTPKEYLELNYKHSHGEMIDPRTKEGRRVLSMRARSATQLLSQLQDYVDPSQYYNKYALAMAAASLSLMTEKPVDTTK